VLAELLVARGITDANAALAFLHPEISHLHDPLLMMGMAVAVERLERRLRSGSRCFSTAITTWTARRLWCC